MQILIYPTSPTLPSMTHTMLEIKWAVWILLVFRILLLYNLLSYFILQGSASTVTNYSEAIALLRLRGDLGIRKIYWPRDSDPCSAWTGILCEQGHVVGIELGGLRRTTRRALHPSFSLDALQRLHLLRSLNASGFALPGAIPDWFGQLSELQILDLTSAFINGSIPSSLGGLSNLKKLSLAHNSLSGGIPSILGELFNLTSLDLAFNTLSGSIPVSITSLRNLTLLDLSSNILVGNIPASIGNLVKLQGLMLASNDLSGSIPNHIGDLILLNKINLASNALSGPIPMDLGKLAMIETLILSNNSLSGPIPTDIANCRQLQVLSLDHNNLTGALPAALGSLKNLSNLDLSFNNLTGVLPVGISTLSEAIVFILSHNLFYGPLPTGVTDLPKLVTLDVSYNYFNGSLSENNATVVQLEENCLGGAARQRTFAACKLFYSLQGISFHEIIGAPAASSAAGNSHKKSKRLRIILGGAFGGLGFVLIIIVVVVFMLKQERSIETVGRENDPAPLKDVPQLVSPNFLNLGDQFLYSQLEQATEDFSAANLLKTGHSGDIYQGLLEGGVPVVVKMIDQSRFSKDAYLTELGFFEKASHTRLVPLLGHCLEREDQKLLVYKYMPNRDLAYALHRRANTATADDSLYSLDWITRLKIAIGVAEGLAYLHHECTPPFVHRDVQASSILLDDKFEVRLGSLTEACIAEAEAHHGVIARILRKSQMPEQGEPRSSATCSNDVYCFGKVLLELVSGKLGISGSTDPSADAWLEWALPLINIYDKEFLSKLMDPSLIVDEDLLEEVWAMTIVAKSCLNPKPSKRPPVKYILKALENPLKVVREDTSNGSGRGRTSSQISWNAAFFGSWRHSSSETVALPGSLREEYTLRSGSKRLGNGGSQGSGQGNVSHRRLGSSEIFPEPVEESILQGSNTDSEQQER